MRSQYFLQFLIKFIQFLTYFCSNATSGKGIAGSLRHFKRISGQFLKFQCQYITVELIEHLRSDDFKFATACSIIEENDKIIIDTTVYSGTCKPV
jgi:hypothetical protein